MKNLLYILLFAPLALFGQDNYSLSFDGVDDYVIVPDFEFESEYISEFSFITLCKVNEVNHIQNIFRKKWADGFWLRFKATQDGGQLTFNDGDAGGIVQFMTTLSDFADFHYLSLTYSNAILKLYIDGELVESVGHTSLIKTHFGNDLFLGAGSENSEQISGLLDNVSFWRKCLSEEEIQQYTSCPITGNHIELIANWSFNEGSGDTAYDLSGNENHGVISGATYSDDVPEQNCKEGCTDSLALNYDAVAGVDDGSCISIIDSLNSIIEEATTSLSSMQQALDTWNTTIDLDAGWNMFGYGCPAPIDLVQAMSEHTDNIIILKDNNGNAYMPEFGYNGIGDLSPGLGYQIKVTEAIEGFSLCDWYVNDIPEDNIVSLQEELASAKAELDSLYGCMDEGACNFDPTAVLNDSSCDYETCLDECGVINGDNTTCLDCAGVPNGTTEDLGCGCGNPAAQEGYDCEGNEITSYRVGDLAHGGIVFYVDETGQHGLVVALEDLGSFEWGCYGMGIPGADGQAIGTGYQNTLDVVNQGCTSEDGGITAAQAALDAEINGYSDWYLPSKDELKEMYNTIGNGGSEGNIGGFETSDWPYCWSSSEGYHGVAWGVYFGNGATYTNYKHYSYRVRVIRAF